MFHLNRFLKQLNNLKQVNSIISYLYLVLIQVGE